MSGQNTTRQWLYHTSDIYDIKALVELESQSDNINEPADHDISTLRTELQTEKAATGYKTITEFSESYKNIAGFTERLDNITELPNGAKTLGGGAVTHTPSGKSVYVSNIGLQPPGGRSPHLENAGMMNCTIY